MVYSTISASKIDLVYVQRLLQCYQSNSMTRRRVRVVLIALDVEPGGNITRLFYNAAIP
jgi:hypothetical protein